jgi:hypothetical protein
MLVVVDRIKGVVIHAASDDKSMGVCHLSLCLVCISTDEVGNALALVVCACRHQVCVDSPGSFIVFVDARTEGRQHGSDSSFPANFFYQVHCRLRRLIKLSAKNG